MSKTKWLSQQFPLVGRNREIKKFGGRQERQGQRGPDPSAGTVSICGQ
jgi:hypothetical protein